MPNEAKLQPVAQQLCGAPSDPKGIRPGATCTRSKGHADPSHHSEGYFWADGGWSCALTKQVEDLKKETDLNRRVADSRTNMVMQVSAVRDEYKARAEAAEAALAALTASQLEDIRGCYKSAGEPYSRTPEPPLKRFTGGNWGSSGVADHEDLAKWKKSCLAERKKEALKKALETPLVICAVILPILVAVVTTHSLSAVLGKAIDWVVFMGVGASAVAFTVLWQAIDTYRKAMAESRYTTKGGR